MLIGGRRPAWVVPAFVAMSLAACAGVTAPGVASQDANSPAARGGANGAGGSGSGGSRFTRSDAAPVELDASADMACGAFTFKPTPKNAVTMLVLDRSGSMKDSLPKNAGTKWTVVTAALDPVVLSTQKAIQWGLKTFPTGTSNCAVAAGVDVPVAPMNYAKMTAAIAATTPDGNGTPTGDGVRVAAAYLQALTSTDPKYILLATDGDPNCPGNGITYALQQVSAAQQGGIPTFVIGVGTGNGSSKNLDALAVAGGEARAVTTPASPRYFPADSPAALTDALNLITGQIAACVFSLGKQPPDPQLVHVTLGATEIPFDVAGQNGWAFAAGDMSTIHISGSWCQTVQMSADAVNVVFGCRPPIIP